MACDPEKMLEKLAGWLAQFPSVLVAYSGGVDSALVMAAAHRKLGAQALACIGVSPSYPEREMQAAVELAQSLGAKFRLVPTQEVLNPNYAANPENRCYFCKTELYDRLRAVADQEDFAVILDGTNTSDLGDHRPGRVAATEHGVRSPLVELGATKDDVRAMARALNLPVWEKPAMACLSSRVPHGTPIVPALLGRIERAEDVLVRLGFKQFRVRHHGDIARIELAHEDLAKALELRDDIVASIRATGYRHVTLDLAGFRRS